MRRILIAAGLVLALAVVGALVLLGSNLNGIVAKLIEKQGSAVTGTAVSVSGVDISLRKARGAFAGLRIASPAGFGSEPAFALGNITLDLDPASLRGEPIVIEELRVSAPVVRAVLHKDGSSNIDTIRKHVQSHAGGGAEGQAGAAKRLRIERFVFEEGQIAVDASAFGLEPRTIALPAIRLENLGGSQGATPDAIAKQVIGALAKQATETIARSEVKGLIEQQLGGSLGDKAKGLLEKLR